MSSPKEFDESLDSLKYTWDEASTASETDENEETDIS